MENPERNSQKIALILRHIWKRFVVLPHDNLVGSLTLAVIAMRRDRMQQEEGQQRSMAERESVPMKAKRLLLPADLLLVAFSHYYYTDPSTQTMATIEAIYPLRSPL